MKVGNSLALNLDFIIAKYLNMICLLCQILWAVDGAQHKQGFC